MKDKLLDWVNGQRDLDVTSKFILYRLAQFADGECCAWAPIKVLAEAVNTSERTVQYRLKAFIAAGLLKPTGRMHRLQKSTRSVPVYQLAPGVEGLGLRAETGPGMGAKSAPIGPHGCKNRGCMGAAVCTCKEPIGTEVERSSDLSPGAGAREPSGDRFDEGLAAFPPSGRKRTDVPASRSAWAAIAAEVGAGRLVAAVRAQAVDPDLARGDFGACSLQRWLAERRFEAFLPPDAGSGAAARAGRFPGPAELRAEIVAEIGEAAAVSLLDPAGWREGDKIILTRTETAAQQLRQRASRVLRAAGVGVEAGARIPAEVE